MRRAWKLYDKCYREISEIGGPFLNWSPEISVQENGASDADPEEVPDLESTEVGRGCREKIRNSLGKMLKIEPAIHY